MSKELEQYIEKAILETLVIENKQSVHIAVNKILQKLSELKASEGEYLICSAIWFDDKKEYVHQPKNIKTGFVVCGRRHHNCFMTLSIASNENSTHLKYESSQGFLTNTDRFVDRKEGGEIAFASGQTKELRELLFSEDLY